MTVQEAKGFIQGKLDCMDRCDVFECKSTDECENCNYCYSQGTFGEQEEAFKFAIKCMEELEQYRALGTVEGFQSALDSSMEYYNQMKKYKYKSQDYEALGTPTQICERIGALDVELGKYHCLGTVEELKEAREKQKSRREWYQKGYQDGLNADKWISCEVGDLIDKVFSHSEIVALWIEEKTEDVRYDKQIWRGMAWEIPKTYRGCKFLKIFGTVPESICEADTINIRIELPQPYKKEGVSNENT